MKLIEAIEILRAAQPAEVHAFCVNMVCGFNPLHLQTFLTARLRQLFPDMRPEIVGGLYGDFWGNLERAEAANAEVCVIVMEWSDLDPRLGIRGLGSWAPEALEDILTNAKGRKAQFEQIIKRVSNNVPAVVCLPTLPLPPVSFAPGWQASAFDLELRSVVSSMALEAARCRNVRVINPARLDRASPPEARLDVKAELLSGFPYKLPHASTIAELMCLVIRPAVPKKGLITDLDDTLWNGILGEVGAEGVSWDLEHNSHMHGVYQRLLHSLSAAGILIGAASKNAADAVEEALRREDLVVPRSALFPVEANWGSKSESVSRILKAWNIGADSIVFIDDSAMELAEVKSRHPEVECILFPKDDPQAIHELLHNLRDLFGKSTLSEEDSIRRESIRQSHTLEVQLGSGPEAADNFLKQSEAEITLNLCKSPLDPRAIELVNKTNQFNLNGRRFTETSWRTYVSQPDSVFVLAAYRDKYGPLGKIAVLAGRKVEKTITLSVWVMSCRAFSRRIEDRCLSELFQRYDIDQIEFEFVSTPRNGPIHDFLAGMLGAPPLLNSRLTRDQFMTRSAKTFQKVVESAHG
jgi:FkbH-like protein